MNEQLIEFKGRSKHIMILTTKAADQGFKIYSICHENYLCSFLFTSKICKIAELIPIRGLTDSSSVVVQLCKSLPVDLNYVVYTDNFFSCAKLFIALKKLGIGACDTAKADSDYSVPLLKLRKALSKKKD